MRPTILSLALLACWLLVAPASASEFKTGPLTIMHPWSRPTATLNNGVVYMTITNTRAVTDQLLSAQTPAAERVEFHTTTTENGIARMRQLDLVEVPAQGRVILKPGSTHLMLVALKDRLKINSSFPLELVFANAGPVRVTVTVQKTPLTDHDDADPPAHSGH